MKPRSAVGLTSLMVACLTSSTAASAALVTYTSKSGFLADTGASSATGAIPAATVTHMGAFTLGSVTISAPRWFTGDRTGVFPGGGEIAVSQGAGDAGGFVNDGVDTDFAGAVDAAGFEFYEPVDPSFFGCNTACVNSTYVVRVMNGSTVLEEVSLTHARGTAQFFGISSTVAFTGLRIRETVGTDDNEYYGQFFTHTAATPPPPGVPEPATPWLVLASLLALAQARRRR